jgi:hypothetical protein
MRLFDSPQAETEMRCLVTLDMYSHILLLSELGNLTNERKKKDFVNSSSGRCEQNRGCVCERGGTCVEKVGKMSGGPCLQ